jgi:hypothetical protein
MERIPQTDLALGGPVRCATPFADLGIIDGLRVHLLSVEQWALKGELRIGVCGPDGWLDLENGPVRGRWEVTGENDHSIEGFFGSGGGDDHLFIGNAVLPVLDKLPLPWTIRLHRNGMTSASATVTELRERTMLRPTTVTPLIAADSDVDRRECRRCTAPMNDTGGVCSECRTASKAWSQALWANPQTASPSGQPLLFDLGATANGGLSIIAIESWPGWFTLRVHWAEEWDAHSAGARGVWTLCDDFGNKFRGTSTSGCGDETGFAQDVAFTGSIDRHATRLRLKVTVRGSVALEADLPIAPQSWPD